MASLPSGYKKLEYIESSGTQYIDTGVRNFSTQYTRVVLDVDWLSCLGCYFGYSHSVTLRWFANAYSSTSIHSGFMKENKSATIATVIGRYIVDKNGSSTNVNGVKILHTAADTTISGSILLLALGVMSGVTDIAGAARIYSCEIYSGSIITANTIVRKFVPCKNSSGEVGLYDEINDAFYGNAGTGVFIAGPEASTGDSSSGGKHKTLIAGTSYDVKSGRTLIGGTGYDIKKGRTLIGGTGYDISFGTPIGELPAKTSVFANFDNTRREFIITNQGNPDSTKYDASCNGTWLLIKNCYGKRMWDKTSKPICNYSVSSIHEYLNNECFNLFDSDMRSLIKTVKIPYINCPKTYQGSSNQSYGPVNSGADGVTAQLFLLSPYEVGWTINDAEGQWLNGSDGERLEAFKSSTGGNSDRIAYLDDGSLTEWWLRSPRKASLRSIFGVYTDGTLAGFAQIYGSSPNPTVVTLGVRFALILPQETLIDSDFNIIPA